MSELAAFWSYLSEGPLLWLALTLAAYVVGDACFRWSGRKPWVNSVLIAVAILAAILWGTGTPYGTYFEGAQFVHFLLGPATVALSLPLFDNLNRLRRATLPVVAALIAGSATATGSAVAIAWALGAGPTQLASIAPKSATAPVAIGIAERVGGAPTLTAVLVILTGIVGAVAATPLLDALGIRDWRARGLAVGIASHGIGTARAFQVNTTAGAFAGLGMALNAIATAFVAPLVLWLFL
ncbi:LrgB family protein [Albidovulum sediminicola]|uniref:LrgB family protein n=1 Tax=Albidovulum sediminicola TaxID=2984331 RepID=A0ABT2Z2M8_9RHOB|nr:LrgB family protein [Defluviimonas sp. WL0075]MCV2865036.1 LrgB family protein [Defluviimonas sp. WL0075]